MKAKFLLMFSVFICGLFAQAFAQAELPLTSLSQTRAEYIKAATSVEAYMYSNGGTSGPSVGVAWAGSKPASEIAAISKLNLRIDMLSLDSNVQTQVAILDKTGQVLFDGYTNTKPELVNGVWTLPKSAGDIQFKMAWTTWIATDKDISQAWIYALDSNGNTQQYELAVDGKRFLFGNDSRGLQNAYVKVNNADGTTAAWTISDGKRRSSVTLATTPEPKFLNVASFKNPTAAITQVITVTKRNAQGGPVGTIPTIEVILDSDGIVTLDVSTSLGGRPVSYSVNAPGFSGWSGFSAGATTTQIRLLKGTNYVVPVFKTDVLIEEAQPIQTGGGKG
jgi:hypothetical protein